MKNILLLIVLIMICLQSESQKIVPYFGKINWVNGFAKEISGENINYYSAFPDYATTALLSRTTDGNKTIEWETAPVPKNIKGQYVWKSLQPESFIEMNSGERKTETDEVKLAAMGVSEFLLKK